MLVLFLFFIFEIQGVSKVAQRLNLLFFFILYMVFLDSGKKKNTRGILGFYIWSSIILYCLKPNMQVGAFVYSMAFQSCEHFQLSHSSVHCIFLNCFIEDPFVLHFMKRSHNFENKTESKEQLNSS